MRWFSLALLLVAGCGGSNPRPTPTPTPSSALAEATAVATPSGPWSEPLAGRRTPLACPASSSRAGWASRVRALGGGRYVKLSGRRLAAVDRDGRVLRRHALGARGDVRLACGRGGRLAVAWVSQGKERDTLRLHAGGRTRTIDSASTPFSVDAISSFALAYAPDGTLLLAYAVPSEIRAVTVSPSGATGRPFRLGPASELSTVVADIARNGRAVVAWSTIDAGEERNVRRRIYAVIGRGPARLVERVRYLNISATSDAEIALALAPNGRALLAYAADRRAVGDLDYDEGVDAPMEVRFAEAGPRGAFRPSRRLAHTGRQASAAIRSDGTKLVVFDTDDGLRAFFGKRFGPREVVTRGDQYRYPTASFTRAGAPMVEWQAGASTRTG